MLKNLLNSALGRYAHHPEAAVISCFFDPVGSAIRRELAQDFYHSVKHLNHLFVECAITLPGKPLPEWVIPSLSNSIRVTSGSTLWHKESMLNFAIERLPVWIKYVFWVDADVVFSNRNWLVDGVKALQKYHVVQAFDYCKHLEQDEKPNLKEDLYTTWSREHDKYYQQALYERVPSNRRCWRSFGLTHVEECANGSPADYNALGHGHTGFAWGARREILDQVPLYDHALIGGADHIMAHAAAGELDHPCIFRAFKSDMGHVKEWSRRFNAVVHGNLGYVPGNVLHLWHGDLSKRQYLERITDFTPLAATITTKDSNGLYQGTKQTDQYVGSYFARREVTPVISSYPKRYKEKPVLKERAAQTVIHDDNSRDFLNSVALGYAMDSTLAGGLLGGDYTGAMVGEMLRDSQKSNEESHGQGAIPVMPSHDAPSPYSEPASTNAPVELERSEPQAPVDHHGATGSFS